MTTSTVFVLGIACVLPLVSALGCAPDEPPPAGLQGRVFLVETVFDSPSPPLVGDGRPTLRFGEGMEVEADAGCNTWSASYTDDDDRLEVTDASQGTAACEAELGAMDEWYFAFLESSPALVLDGDELVLARDATRIEYLADAVATPTLELIGPTWTVESITRGEIEVAITSPMPATLEFDAGGSVVIDTGCNTGAGGYARAGVTISFSTVSVTNGACPGDPETFDDDRASLEATVLSLLRDSPRVTWRLMGKRLWLDGDSNGLILVAND